MGSNCPSIVFENEVIAKNNTADSGECRVAHVELGVLTSMRTSWASPLLLFIESRNRHVQRVVSTAAGMISRQSAPFRSLLSMQALTPVWNMTPATGSLGNVLLFYLANGLHAPDSQLSILLGHGVYGQHQG